MDPPSADSAIGSAKRVAVIAYTDYDTDGRVRREAETLVSVGFKVSAIVVRSRHGNSVASARQVRLHEIPIAIKRGGYLRYAYQYGIFFLLSCWLLVRLHIRERFSLVHIHSLPDFEVFASLPLKLMGVPVLLDLHEAMPEILAARFGLPPESLVFRVAGVLERASCAFADMVIAANDGIRNAVVARCTPGPHIVSIYNAPELAAIPAPSEVRAMYGLPDLRLIVHAGGINQERDLETLLRAVAMLPERLTCGVVFVGSGEPEYVSRLRTLSESLGLSHRVWFLGQLPIGKAQAVSSLSAVGVVTLESNPITRLAWPTRIAEFVALGKTLVIADLPFLRGVLGPSASYYTPGEPATLARELERALDLESHGSRLAAQAGVAIRPFEWSLMRQSFINVCLKVTQA